MHFSAKKIGKGKWVALCPSHPDRKPSLSIREGNRGVILRCWSMGCDVNDILKAAGLTMSHLFYDHGTKVDPKARAEMQRKRRATENAEARTKRQIAYWTDEVRKWEAVAALLHARLIRGDSVAAMWHRALDTARLRHARLLEYWKSAPEVECYTLTRVPPGVTAAFVGREIAEVLF